MAPATLDGAFFPHLVDMIFDEAPAGALLALRVCKAWRHRAEAQLAYHLTIREEAVAAGFPFVTLYALESARGRIGTIKSSSMLSIPLNMVPTFLSSTAVIDVRAPSFKLEMRRALHFRRPEVTYRCHESCNLWNSTTLQPRSVVLFAEDIRVYDTIKYFYNHGLRALQECERLVLHLREMGGQGLSPSHQDDLKGVKSLTLIIHPWHMRSTRTSAKYPLEELLTLQMGLFVDCLLLAWWSQVPTTVVGFDFSDFEAQHPDVGNVRTLVMRNFAHRRDNFFPSGAAAETPPPRFLTLDEYRAEVGEERFEIETNEGPLTCPRMKQVP